MLRTEAGLHDAREALGRGRMAPWQHFPRLPGLTMRWKFIHSLFDNRLLLPDNCTDRCRTSSAGLWAVARSRQKLLDASSCIAAKRQSSDLDSIRVVAIEPQASSKLLLTRFSGLPA